MNWLARVETEQRLAISVARVHGEVDISNAQEVSSELEAAVPNGATALVVDLTGTTYLDSAGLGMLVRLAERLRGRRQQLRVVVPDDAPIRVAFEVTGIPQLVQVHPRLEDALQAGPGETPVGEPG